MTRSPSVDDGLLVDAGVLVRAAELEERVDVRAEVAGLAVLVLRLDAHDDAPGVDRVDDAVPLAEDDGARVAGDDALEARADERRLGPEERHRLALHVRAHEGPVRVVVLEERDERRGDRNELLRRHVHELDLVLLDRDELAAGAGDDPVLREPALVVDLGVRLGDDVVLLFPGGLEERGRAPHRRASCGAS